MLELPHDPRQLRGRGPPPIVLRELPPAARDGLTALPSYYDTKTRVLAPRAWWLRRRYRDRDPYTLAILEEHHYRRSMLEFMAFAGAHPGLLTDFAVPAGGVVVDAGAFVGEWAAEMAERHDCAAVYAFEPASGCQEALRAVQVDHPEITVVPAGLSNADRSANLALAGPGSKVAEGDGAFGHEEIRLRDVVGVLAELGVEHIDVLKINIEGGEFDVLPRLLRSGWIPHIDSLLIQYHEWAPGAPVRRQMLRRQLRRTHTEAWNHPWVFERWDRTGRV